MLLPPAFQPVIAVVDDAPLEAVIGGAVSLVLLVLLSMCSLFNRRTATKAVAARKAKAAAKLSTPASKTAGTSPGKSKNKSKSPDSVTSPTAEREEYVEYDE